MLYQLYPPREREVKMLEGARSPVIMAVVGGRDRDGQTVSILPEAKS